MYYGKENTKRVIFFKEQKFNNPLLRQLKTKYTKIKYFFMVLLS